MTQAEIDLLICNLQAEMLCERLLAEMCPALDVLEDELNGK